MKRLQTRAAARAAAPVGPTDPGSPSQSGSSPHQTERAATETWRSLRAVSQAQIYPAGAELLTQGSRSRGVYLVAKGMVKLTHASSSGQTAIVGLRAPGWIVGAAAAIRSRPSAVTATTLTICRIRIVEAERFRTMVRLVPDLSWQLHQMHSREIHQQLLQSASLATLTARERLQQLLRRLSHDTTHSLDGSARLKIPLRMWEVAQLIAVTPTYLSDLLTELESAGIIQRSKGWLCVLDRDRL